VGSINVVVAADSSSTLILDSKGQFYELNSQGKWQKVNETRLSDPEFQRPRGQMQSAGGETKIAPGNQVFVDTGYGFNDSGLKPPPSGQYERAHLDKEGNLFVELSSGGFLFKAGQGNLVIPPSRMEWNGTAPSFSKLLGNPYGSGLLGLTSDGRIFRIEVPTRTQRQFSAQEIQLDSPVKEAVLQNGKVLLGSQDGNLSYLESDSSAPKTRRVSLPEGISGENIKLISSAASEAGEIARSAQAALQLRLNRENASQVSAATSSVSFKSNLKPGEKIETRNGEKVRVDAQGKVLPPPPSVLKSLEGNRLVEPFISATKDVISDRLALSEHLDEEIPIFGREKESASALDTLIRMKGKNPVLVGEPGVGKTAIAELISKMISSNALPTASEYQKVLRDAIVVQTTPAAISALAKSDAPSAQQAAVEQYLAGLKAAEKALGRKIILYVDEMHLFSEPQLEALKTTLDSKDGILFVGSTTHNEYGLMIGRNGALERRFQPLSVPEFSKEDTRKLLKEAIVPQLERKYAGKDKPGKITDEAIEAAINHAPEYLPNSARPEGPFKLLQDAMIKAHRAAEEKSPTLGRSDVGKFVADSLRLPFDPSDPNAIIEGTQDLKAKLREAVVDQNRVTDALADLWKDVYLSSSGGKSHKVLLVAGPTGAGKTFSAQSFAKEALGDEQRVLEIDATKYRTGGLSLNSLLGAPPGVVSSDKFRGLLPEFLSGKGKGANVIVINEIDKADKELMEALMEMMDTGKLQGGDGKTYRLGRSIVILTTNKGDEAVYPRGLGYIPSRKEMEARLQSLDDKKIKELFMQPNRDNLLDRQATQLPPSILGRIDAAVPAAPPSLEGALAIARQKADQLSKQHEEKFKYRIHVDDSALKRVIDSVYVPEDGVRDVNRAVERLFNEAMTLGISNLSPKAGDSLEVALQRGKTGEADFISVENSNGKKGEWVAPSPRIRGDNPLLDAEKRKQLASLEENLGKSVFGQPEAIKMVARGLRNKSTHASDPKPASFLLLGRTGTGKTETGKGIAEALFGNPKKLISFNMGEVKWEGDLNKIFGVTSGFSGSDKTSPFERFLQDHPEGGVVMFDEIGNMGGGKTNHAGSGAGANSKTELLQKFYQMIDEGTYRSPNTGKTYDLRKFSFVFTSNEGQNLATAPTDDLALSLWKENNKLPKLISELKKEGWPEPLLARLGSNITLYKPLVAEERASIARKLVEETTEALKKQHGIREIKVDPNFYKTVADSFFSHEQGARAMRNLSNGALTSLIGDALFDQYDPNVLQNATFELSLTDNFSGKYRHSGTTPPDRSVQLSLKVKVPGMEDRVYSSDITSEATEKKLSSNRDLRATAFHEVGHVVVNDPNRTGEVPAFVTIRGADDFGGYARYENQKSKKNLTRADAVAIVGRLLGGMVGQRAMGIEDDSSWQSDIQRARSLAEKMVADYGLSEKALRFPVSNGKVITGDPVVQEEIRRLLEEGEEYAQQRVQERWPLFRLLASELLKRGHLEKDKIAALEKRAKSPEHSVRPKRPHPLGSSHLGCEATFRALTKE
jgi:ATP-dependent Clp protease ATP-binding subunit ClpC